MILDGWGLGDHSKADVIYCTPTPYWDYLTATYPHSQLQASGENVGLPNGQMGNSEVGHLNIGAGRIVYQDLVKINRACADNSILKNPEIVSAFTYARDHKKNIHFMGLTSNGGVHSSLEHLFKLCDIAREYGLDNTFIHCFMDGRDTDPHSGKGFIAELQEHCAHSAGKIASIMAVTMPWTAISVGSASRLHMTCWYMVRVKRLPTWLLLCRNLMMKALPMNLSSLSSMLRLTVP